MKIGIGMALADIARLLASSFSSKSYLMCAQYALDFSISDRHESALISHDHFEAIIALGHITIYSHFTATASPKTLPSCDFTAALHSDDLRFGR